MTPNMRRALVAAASPEGISPWDYGSGTIGALKKANLIERRVLPHPTGHGVPRYFATEAGRREIGVQP